VSEGSSTQVAIPDALTASVQQCIQYGMKFPNGNVEWNTVQTNRGTLSVERIADGTGTSRSAWSDHLTLVAKEAKANAYDYSNGHKIITRTVVVAVTEAADHSDLRPWDVLDPGKIAPPAPPWS
jgi:anti-sigma regulatory factor (Ser/Thr protein kinase)